MVCNLLERIKRKPDVFILKMRDAGFCPLPLGPEKHPAIPWKGFQDRLPTESDIRSWYLTFDDIRWCFLTGSFTRHEAFDFDHDAQSAFYEFWGLVGDLIEHCPIVKTRKGYHVHYRTDESCKGMVLARTKDNQVRIETRGNKNIIVAPPGLDGAYRLINGDFLSMPTMSQEQRAKLWAAARSLNQGTDGRIA